MSSLVNRYRSSRQLFCLYDHDTYFTIIRDRESEVDAKSIFWELPAEVQFPLFFDIAIRNPQCAIEVAGFSYQLVLGILLSGFALSSFV